SSRRRHTRSKRDWSSDVCSSDLGAGASADRRFGAGPRLAGGTVQTTGRCRNFSDFHTAKYTKTEIKFWVLWILHKCVKQSLGKRSEERRVGKECKSARRQER